jgi:hypothetical protein
MKKMTIREFIKLGTCDSSHGSCERDRPESVDCDSIVCETCPAYVIGGDLFSMGSCIDFYNEKKRKYISRKLEII